MSTHATPRDDARSFGRRPGLPRAPAILRHGFALAGALCLAVAARAHPWLDHARPGVGSMVSSAPAELKLWFTEELKPLASTIDVTGADGERVAAGAAHRDPHDARLLAVPLVPLAPGEYTVVWRAVSVDTHATQGRFTFRVGR